jgi:hypothetical protein
MTIRRAKVKKVKMRGINGSNFYLMRTIIQSQRVF